jgi:ribosomal protein L23
MKKVVMVISFDGEDEATKEQIQQAIEEVLGTVHFDVHHIDVIDLKEE